MLLDLWPLQTGEKLGDSGNKAARATYSVRLPLEICPICHGLIGDGCACPPNATRRRDEDLLVLVGAL